MLRSNIIIGISFFLLTTTDVFAKNIQIDPSISIDEIITDNIRLVENSKDDELITSIKPSIRIVQEGRKLNSRVNYLLENNNYLNESESDILHTLDLNSEIEFIENIFTTEVEIRNSQQNITNTGILGTENTSLTNNAENILTYKIIPTLSAKYSNLIRATLSHDFNTVDSDRFSSDSENLTFTMNSGSYFSRFAWNTNFQDRTIETSASETNFRRFTASVQYFVSRKYSVNVTTGYEDNDFPGIQTDSAGVNWTVGMTWRPSPRTELDLAIGERFFGTNYQASLSHTHKRLVVVAEYSETPQLSRENLLNQQLFNTTDLLGEFLTSPDISNARSLNINAVNQSNNVFINRNFEFNTQYNHRRYEISLGLNYSERDFLNTSNETNYGASISLDYTLNRKSRLNTAFTYDSQDNILSIQRERYRMSINLRRELTSLTTANLFYTYTTSNSDAINNNFEENRLGVTLNRSF